MRSAVKLAAFAVAVVIATQLTDDRFLLRVITLTLVWAAAGLAWNLVAKAGQISLAHSAFVGIGAYSFAILLRTDAQVSPWIGMAVGMVIAAALAVVIGLPTFRLKGFYFTLATLSFPLMLELLVAHFGDPELTIPFKPGGGWAYLEFGDPTTYIWILLVMVVLFIGVTILVDVSPFGLALAATRDNEVLARAVGVRTRAWKMAAFVISAGMAAAVAVLWVKSVLRVTTAEETFSVEIVIVMLSVSAVGGVGRTWAPVVGSVLLTPLALLLDRWVGSSIRGIQEMVYGVALVLVAVLFPDGVLAVADRFRSGSGHRTMSVARHHPQPQPAVAGSQPLLVVDNVAKRFGALKVLSDVSFSLLPGRRLGLIGPNGAGKTTLFNILTAHLRADAGRVVMSGVDIGQMTSPALFEHGISRTFQVPQGFHRMTVRDNVLVAAVGARAPNPLATSIRSLERVGLGAKIDADLSALTVAETKFLELARAIVSEPKLLLLDEPLAGLNETERHRFFETVDDVIDENTGVVVIEHSVRSVLGFVDDLIALDGGVIIAAGRPQDVVQDEQVMTAYLGQRWRTHAVHS